VTLPDPNIVANGPWLQRSPYLGGEATTRAAGSTPIPPPELWPTARQTKRFWLTWWHSHNQREITTNNIFRAAC